LVPASLGADYIRNLAEEVLDVRLQVICDEDLKCAGAAAALGFIVLLLLMGALNSSSFPSPTICCIS
jgi:hypothetical protein